MQVKIRSEKLARGTGAKWGGACEFCFPILGGVCSGELPLAKESFDKLLQFECKISATVHFVNVKLSSKKLGKKAVHRQGGYVAVSDDVLVDVDVKIC